MSEIVRTGSIDKCHHCRFFGKVTLTHAQTGEMFFGNPVHDDVLLCDLCRDTWGLEGDVLIRYIGNLILQKLNEV